MRPFVRLGGRAGCCVPSPASAASRLASFSARPPPRRRPPPPPPGAKGRRLPPPPPLGAAASSSSPLSSSSSSAAVPPTTAAASSLAGGLLQPWKSPHEVLSALIAYVPTFFVPVPTVAAILPEETRAVFAGRGRLLNFLRRYPFFFDTRALDGGARVDVRLRDDVSHPQRGVADEKFAMIDVGEVTNYVAKAEYIVSADSLEQGSLRVNVVPPSPPPSVRVQLEERVPVLERLQALIPASFTAMDALEDELPEDILFHPYFDCQGGLPAIAGKFPQHFQVVNGEVRLRPPHIAPLALNDWTLDESPIPAVAALVQRVVCAADIPHWVSLTTLYEELSREQKREIKRGFRSFAGFLRSHGRSVAVSQDMLQVSKWIAPSPPSSSPSLPHPESPIKYTYTQTQVMNELYERLPASRAVSLTEALALLPPAMAAHSLPRRVLGWLASHPQYFLVDDASETDPDKVRLRKAAARQPLDLAVAVYGAMADRQEMDGDAILAALPPKQRAIVAGYGWAGMASALDEWIAVAGPTGAAAASGPARVRRLRSLEALERAVELESAQRDS